MFGSLYFRGCKYTNKILFINKNIVFQHFVLLITCHLDRVPLCHLDRAERVERSPLPAFLPEKHNAIPPEAQRQTVRQLLGQIHVGRCRKRRQNTPKRDRPSCFSTFWCRTVWKSAFSGRNLHGIRESFYRFVLTSWHFERDVANDGRERKCKG